MNFGEWQAKLYENPGTVSIDLYLYRTTPAGRQMLTHEGIVKTLKEGDPSDFNDYFARFGGREQLNTIAEALLSFGVQTSSDAKNQGLLEAKEAHLQDMRKLVFKDKA